MNFYLAYKKLFHSGRERSYNTSQLFMAEKEIVLLLDIEAKINVSNKSFRDTYMFTIYRI